MDIKRIPPDGDPFTSAHPPDQDEHPHACVDGLVFLTYTAFDGSVGDEVERLEVLPCRRCSEREAVEVVEGE